MSHTMPYAKLLSIGDLTEHGAPLTIEKQSGERHVILLEPSQCLYFHSRLEAITSKMPGEKPLEG